MRPGEGRSARGNLGELPQPKNPDVDQYFWIKGSSHHLRQRVLLAQPERVIRFAYFLIRAGCLLWSIIWMIIELMSIFCSPGSKPSLSQLPPPAVCQVSPTGGAPPGQKTTLVHILPTTYFECGEKPSPDWSTLFRHFKFPPPDGIL